MKALTIYLEVIFNIILLGLILPYCVSSLHNEICIAGLIVFLAWIFYAACRAKSIFTHFMDKFKATALDDLVNSQTKKKGKK